MKKNWGWFLGICIVLVLSVLPLAACTDRGTGETVTFTVGDTTGLATTNNPFVAPRGSSTSQHIYSMYEPLIYYMSDGTLEPGLAESWTYDAATNTWTIKLNSKAKWSDGNAVNANDVKFTWEKIAAVGVGQAATVIAALDTITVVDARTVNFKLTTPLSMFPYECSHVAIVPQHIWGEMTDQEIIDYTNPTPVGSGPFTLKEKEGGSHISYDARNDYWRGAPHIDVYVCRYYATHEAQLLAIKKGEIDATASFMLNASIPSLLADSKIRVYGVPVNRTITFYPNHRHEPWNLTAFRKAVSMGINRADIISYSADGWGFMPNLMEIAPNLEHSTPELAWPYSDLTHAQRIAQANAALDAIPGMTTIAGGTGGIRNYNGNPLQFNLLCTTSVSYVTTAELIKDDCLEMGIDMTLDMQTATQLVNVTARQKSEATAANWETFLFHREFAAPIDDWASHYGPNFDPAVYSMRSWIIGWQNATIQNKLKQITQLMPGNATRDALIEEVLPLVAAEEPVICLYHSLTPHVYRTDRFTGWMEIAGGNNFGITNPAQHPLQILALRPI